MDVVLKAVGLTKRFGGILALNNVDLEIGSKEYVGIIGPNGAGKTTLFNVLSGHLRPDSGKVTFRGVNITGSKPHVVAKMGLARTFQLVKPFLNLTVLENVVLPILSTNKPHAKHMVEDAALEVLGMVGLEGRCQVAASKLTHGELKRLGVAQALALNPTLVLLDEPFGGLSASEIEVVSHALKQWSSQGTSYVIIEHRVRELMKLVNRVVALDQGTVIKVGAPEEVISDQKVINAFLGSGSHVLRSKEN
jgi:branched-chain amino acid transport system ATP-binding protein